MGCELSPMQGMHGRSRPQTVTQLKLQQSFCEHPINVAQAAKSAAAAVCQVPASRHSTLLFMTQAAETAEAATAAVCDVTYGTPDKAASHQQDGAGVGILSAAAWLHCRPLYQFPSLPMVIYSGQLTPPPPPPSCPTYVLSHIQHCCVTCYMTRFIHCLPALPAQHL